MKKILSIFFAFFVVIIESTVMQKFKVAGILPNLSLVYVSSIALNGGSRWGRNIGFVVGLTQDVLLCPYIGLYTLIYFFLGQLVGLFHRVLRGTNLFSPLLIIIAADILYGFVSFVLYAFLQGQTDIFYYFKTIILPEAAYTSFFAIPAYWLIYWMSHRLNRLRVKNMITQSFSEEEQVEL